MMSLSRPKGIRLQNPHASVETRTSPIDQEASRELRSRHDRHAAAGARASKPTLAPASDGPSDSGAVRYLQPRDRSPHSSLTRQPARAARAPAARPVANDPRRLERDLHDGVQNELVALILQLADTAQDPETPPALAKTLARIEAHAQAALDSVRDIARGIYPAVLADFGLGEALRAHAARAAVDVSVTGAPPRSTAEAEEAVYYACSEAIQNVAKHAGRGARVTLRLHHDKGSLAVRVADDGRGFDPDHTASGADLQNIRGRIEGLGGTVTIASRAGHGAVLTISLPWPTAAHRRQ